MIRYLATSPIIHTPRLLKAMLSIYTLELNQASMNSLAKEFDVSPERS